MNKVRLILLSAVALTACAGMADFMYWQVSDAKFDTPAGGDASFAYATVRTGGGEATETIGTESDYYKLYTVDAEGHAHASDYYMFPADPNDSNSTVGDASFFGTFGSDVTQFLFELWDSDGKLVGYADKSRSEIDYCISRVGESGIPVIPSGDYHAFELQGVVPEPTSGLLLLLGFAGIALRRKRFV